LAALGEVKAAIKSVGNYQQIAADYRSVITSSLVDYFEGGSITPSRNAFKAAMATAFVDMFETAWLDGGAEMPFSEEANDWLVARQELEFGYIQTLFEQAKALRKEGGFDFFSWITARADGYINTLREVYNNALLRTKKDMMVTFEGDDGAESCPDCQRLKGKRHKISWFLARDFVPPFGQGLECHPGGRCQHGLMDDKGNWVTV
jgi:hypothetical protein